MRNGHRGKSHAAPVHVHAHACAHAAIGNITCSRGGASGTEFTVQPAGRVKGGSIRMRPPWEIVVALKLPRTGIHTYTYMRMRMHACVHACVHAGLARTVAARYVNPLVSCTPRNRTLVERAWSHWLRWHSSQPIF